MAQFYRQKRVSLAALALLISQLVSTHQSLSTRPGCLLQGCSGN